MDSKTLQTVSSVELLVSVSNQLGLGPVDSCWIVQSALDLGLAPLIYIFFNRGHGLQQSSVPISKICYRLEEVLGHGYSNLTFNRTDLSYARYFCGVRIMLCFHGEWTTHGAPRQPKTLHKSYTMLPFNLKIQNVVFSDDVAYCEWSTHGHRETKLIEDPDSFL